MITVVEVKTKKQIKEFIEFPLKMYKDNPYFVPPLYGDEKALFKKNGMYDDVAEAIYFNAYRDGKIVGRISGILQHAANERWNQKRIRFTRFDSIDDQDVANALFDAVENWGLSKGMEEICGPLGFSDLDREGLLIEGFDQLSTFEEQYNHEYYKTLIENYGFEKEVDWLERRLFPIKEVDERYERISSLMLKKYNLRIGESKSTADFLNRYADQFFDILDETYKGLYQTVPFTEKMKAETIKGFKLIIDKKNVIVILDENDRVVAFGLCFPAIGEALQKSGGRLTPAAIIKVLHAIKHSDVLDLGLIGVLPEYEKKGIASALIVKIMQKLKEGNGLKYAETNLNLEDNYKIQNQWKAFPHIQHKRRRSFVKKLGKKPAEADNGQAE